MLPFLIVIQILFYLLKMQNSSFSRLFCIFGAVFL
nr:MAG TPA: hypothetical protein [Caudoviricetes sp.]